jgi:hypothetical protein
LITIWLTVFLFLLRPGIIVTMLRLLNVLLLLLLLLLRGTATSALSLSLSQLLWFSSILLTFFHCTSVRRLIMLIKLVVQLSALVSQGELFFLPALATPFVLRRYFFL